MMRCSILRSNGFCMDSGRYLEPEIIFNIYKGFGGGGESKMMNVGLAFLAPVFEHWKKA